MNKLFVFILLLTGFQSCKNVSSEKIERPRDVWAYRSVLDKKPRMFTLALDTACYAAYDLANCKLYKIWKGGVHLQGAAFTDKKNIQPESWGASYTDSIHNNWLVEINGKKDSFHIINKGYRFDKNRVFIKFLLVTSANDSIIIEEHPEFIQENDIPGFERTFTTSGVPEGVVISLQSKTSVFPLKANGTSNLVYHFHPLPHQVPPSEESEYDHRGRYFMEKSDCFTCHELDKNTVGPSFNAIAQRYQNQESIAAKLVNKIKNGGSGEWGNAAMTAHPDLSESDIRGMLEYIFSLKPAVQNKMQEATEQNNKNTSAQNISPGFGAPLEGIHPSYAVQTIHKNNFKPRVGGMAFLPDGRLLVSTWDSTGAIYVLDNVESGDTNKIKVKRIASGLAEPLGLEVANGNIYVLQKQELTRLIDIDGDDVIDEYQAVCNSWGVTGDFHEFAFGLVYKDGYFYATLSMAMRLMSHEKQKPDRGRAIRISPDGSYEWINYGLRTPNGIGLGIDNEIFVTDNQGEWEPSNKLIHIKKGEYHGMRWGITDSLAAVPAVAMPAIWLPENEIANSPSQPVLIKDGPYKGQMLHGDVTYGGIQRDFLEKVNGQFQGAVFRFTQGLEAGVNRLCFGPDSALYIGGVGMVGGWSWKEKQSGLQRMKYNGNPVFEMLAVHATPTGFDIELTEPVAPGFKLSVLDFLIQQWWYLPTSDYGGPKMDLENLKISKLGISDDRKHINLEIPGLKKEHVIYIRLPKEMKSDGNRSLWSSETWYTLNNIPQ
jgi:cytochrome c